MPKSETLPTLAKEDPFNPLVGTKKSTAVYIEKPFLKTNIQYPSQEIPQTLKLNFRTIEFYRVRHAPEKRLFTRLHLEKLLNSGLALRHVSTKEKAISEVQQGTRGDAVNLYWGLCDLFKEVSDNRCFSENVTASQAKDVTRYGPKELCAVLGSMQPRDVDVFCQIIEERLLKFIDDSIMWDLPNSKVNWLSNFLQTFESSTSFSLVKDSAPSYDQRNYYGLGKIGKQEFDVEKYQACFLPPKAVEPLFQEHLETVQGDPDVYNKAVAGTLSSIKINYLERILSFLEQI